MLPLIYIVLLYSPFPPYFLSFFILLSCSFFVIPLIFIFIPTFPIFKMSYLLIISFFSIFRVLIAHFFLLLFLSFIFFLFYLSFFLLESMQVSLGDLSY